MKNIILFLLLFVAIQSAAQCDTVNTVGSFSTTYNSTQITFTTPNAHINYVIVYIDGTDTSRQNVNDPGGPYPHLVTSPINSLTPLTTYDYYIVANCSGPDSAMTSLYSFSTTAPTCDTVTGITVNATNSNATITATEAAYGDTYTIFYIRAGQSDTLEVSGGTADQVLPGLKNSSVYYFRIRTNCTTYTDSVTTGLHSFTTGNSPNYVPFDDELGYQFQRTASFKTFSFPGFNGTPVINGGKNDYPALGADTTAEAIYWFSPKCQCWLPLGGGGVPSPQNIQQTLNIGRDLIQVDSIQSNNLFRLTSTTAPIAVQAKGQGLLIQNYTGQPRITFKNDSGETPATSDGGMISGSAYGGAIVFGNNFSLDSATNRYLKMGFIDNDNNYIPHILLTEHLGINNADIYDVTHIHDSLFAHNVPDGTAGVDSILVISNNLIKKIPAGGGGGGGNNIYNTDSTLSGNRTVNQNGNYLHFISGGQTLLSLIDGENNVFSFNSAGGGNGALHQTHADAGKGESLLQSYYNDGETQTEIRGTSNASGGNILYKATNEHEFKGFVKLDSVGTGADTDSVLTWDATTFLVNRRAAYSGGSGIFVLSDNTINLGGILTYNAAFQGNGHYFAGYNMPFFTMQTNYTPIGSYYYNGLTSMYPDQFTNNTELLDSVENGIASAIIRGYTDSTNLDAHIDIDVNKGSGPHAFSGVSGIHMSRSIFNFDYDSLRVELPPYADTTVFLPLFVNGEKADSTGNITISTGSGGITSLNSQTGATQTFATGTSGTDFGISSASNTHTFNLPVASGTNTGKLSNTDWSTFNGKESALTFNAPLSRSTNTISIPVATSSVNGYLSSTDWTTFNNKGTVTSVSGTTNRITSTGGATPVMDISASYVGQSSITTHGTITSGGLGTGAVIGGVTMTLGSDAANDVYYRNSSGILTRLANGTTGQYLGANSAAAPSWQTPAGNGTTTNTLTFNNGGSGDASGTTFNGSAARTLSYNSIGAVPTSTTVAGFALSSNVTLADLTATNSTVTFSGAYNGAAARTVGLNLANGNTWTAEQITQLTTEQQRLAYDGSNYFTTTVNSTGSTTFAATGTSPTFTISQGLILPNGLQTNVTQVSGNLNIPSGSSGASTPQAAYIFGGASNVGFRRGFRGSTNYTITANHSYAGTLFGAETTTEASSGTHAVNAGAAFLANTITNGSGATAIATNIYIDAAPTGVTGTTGNYSLYDAGGNVYINDKVLFSSTVTAGGTTGNQTINKPTGTVNIAAAGTTVTVTNSFCTTSSIVYCVLRTDDATATGIKNVVPGSGSFVINLNAAATAEVSIGFIVFN